MGKGALVTHVPFRAEGGAKRVFALAVNGKIFRALELIFLPCSYCSLHRKGGAAAEPTQRGQGGCAAETDASAVGCAPRTLAGGRIPRQAR